MKSERGGKNEGNRKVTRRKVGGVRGITKGRSEVEESEI